MGIYLSGGIASEYLASELWGRFIADARTHAGEDTRIAMIAVGPDAEAEARAAIVQAQAHGDARFIPVIPSGQCTLSDIADSTALVVLPGSAGAIRTALAPIDGEIRRRVSGDAPYLGIGAGAVVAAEHALVGGWQIGGVPVSPREYADGYEEVTIEQGLGLLDLSVVVAPSAHGSLGRLIAATEGSLIGGGIGIDLDTALVIADGRLDVIGSGSLWQAIGGDHGVTVSTRGA